MTVIKNRFNKRFEQQIQKFIKILINQINQLKFISTDTIIVKKEEISKSSKKQIKKQFEKQFEKQSKKPFITIIDLIDFIPKLRFEEMRYFDLKYQNEKSFQNFAIVNAEKHVYYRDIYLFVNRLKNLDAQYG